MIPGIVSSSGMSGSGFDPLSLFANNEPGFHFGSITAAMAKVPSSFLSELVPSINSTNWTGDPSGDVEIDDGSFTFTTTGPASVSTNVEVTEGKVYRIQFTVGDPQSTLDTEASLTVSFGSNTLQFGTTLFQKEYELVWAAPSSESVMTISYEADSPSTFEVVIQDVSVREIDTSGLTLFTDPEGVIPVTKPGDLVRGVRDLSPNGVNLHALLGMSPTLGKENSKDEYYLEPNGGIGFETINTLDLSSTDEITVALGVSELPIGPLDVHIVYSDSFSLSSSAADNAYLFHSHEDFAQVDVPPGFAPPMVLSGSAGEDSPFIDVKAGEFDAGTTSPVDTQNYTNSKVFIGGNPSYPLECRIYTLPTIIGRRLTPTERTNLEQWHRKYLPSS